MWIVFVRRAEGECLARVHRPDGVVVELPSYSRKHRVPHDLAHAAVERELGLAHGVFGSIASGAVFKNMRVLDGRPRHDAAARSRRILRANAKRITVAEVMAGVVHRAVESGRDGVPLGEARRAWGSVSEEPFPWTAEEVARTTGALRALARQFASLAPGESMEFDWPDRLIAPVPAAPRRSRAQSRPR